MVEKILSPSLVVGEQNIKAKFHLTSKDYQEIQKIDCTVKSHNKVTFTVYAPAVFSTIRDWHGICFKGLEF